MKALILAGGAGGFLGGAVVGAMAADLMGAGGLATAGVAVAGAWFGHWVMSESANKP